MIFSCETEEFLIPENVKNVRIEMSINTIDKNVLITELLNLGDNGYVMMGLCSDDQMGSRFEGNGSIYVSKLDINGQFEWDTCFFRDERGFPGAILKKNDAEIVLIWNSFDLNDGLEFLHFNISETPSISSFVSQELTIAGEVFDIQKNFEDDGYYLIGLRNNTQNNHFVNIIEVDNDFKLRRTITQRYFDPEQLGGFGLNDIEFLRRLSTHIHILKNFGSTEELNRLIFTGPQDSLMTLSHVGEIIPEYGDSRYWVSSVINTSNEEPEYALIISDSETSNGRTYFNRDIMISGPPDNFRSTDLISSATNLDLIDPNMNILMFQASYDNRIFFIGGTTKAGQVRLFKIDEEQVSKYSIGRQIPLELSGMSEMKNGQILLVGHGVIGNELQKPFVIISDPLLF